MLLGYFFNTFLKRNNTSTLFLVDILYMKDLNAIYGFKNGDFIISQLNNTLKKTITLAIKNQLKKNIHIKIKNSHADIFEILLFDDLNSEELLTI